MSYQTEQERFWAGEFGDAYIGRNAQPEVVAANVALFADVLRRTHGPINSFLELGANIGLNLLALRQLCPQATFSAVEINARAAEALQQLGWVEVQNCSMLGFQAAQPVDFAFAKLVLIHIAPEHLPEVYDALYHSSRRYVMVCEYYNPSPVEVSYRGHSERLFKRDFAGELMDRHPDLVLRDYGFVYHRDARFAQDDCTWFLMEKTGAVAKE